MTEAATPHRRRVVSRMATGHAPQKSDERFFRRAAMQHNGWELGGGVVRRLRAPMAAHSSSQLPEPGLNYSIFLLLLFIFLYPHSNYRYDFG